jgi:hypothetical protein
MRGCVMIGQRIPCHCDATCTIHDARCGKRVGAHSQGGADCDGRHHSHNQRVRSPLQARQRTLADRHSTPQHSDTVAVARHCLSRARTRSRCAQRHHSPRTKHRLCAALPPAHLQRCTDARTHSSQPPVRVSDSVRHHSYEVAFLY